MNFGKNLEWYATIRITVKDISENIERALIEAGLEKPYFSFFRPRTFVSEGVRVRYYVDSESEKGSTRIEITADNLENAKKAYGPLEEVCMRRQDLNLKKIGLQLKRNKEKFKY